MQQCSFSSRYENECTKTEKPQIWIYVLKIKRNNSLKSKDKWGKKTISQLKLRKTMITAVKTRRGDKVSLRMLNKWNHSYLSCSLQYRTQMSWNDECSLQSHHWTQPLTHAGFRRRYCLYDGELLGGAAEGLEDLGMQVTWLAVGVGCREGAGWTGVTSGGCGGTSGPGGGG